MQLPWGTCINGQSTSCHTHNYLRSFHNQIARSSMLEFLKAKLKFKPMANKQSNFRAQKRLERRVRF